MSKRQVLMLIGVWLIIILRLGFPKGWDEAFLIATGLAVIFIAYQMKPPSNGETDDSKDRPYIDNQPGPSGTAS